MAGKGVIPFLVAMMLVTGVCNTLLTKYQDMQCVRNCDSPDPTQHAHFEQPVIQTAQMFIGEMGSWLVIGLYAILHRIRHRNHQHTHHSHHAPHAPQAPTEADPLLAATAGHDPVGPADDYSGSSTLDDNGDEGDDPLSTSLVLPHDGRRELRGWKVVYLALPACCDIAGTTLMNVGLLFVAASIYQMTRGALVLFVGLFSVLFLHRRLGVYKWFALFVVVAGVAIVGLAGAIARDEKAVPGGDGTTPPEKGSQNGWAAVTTGAEMAPAVRTIVGVLLIAAAQIFTASQFVLEESIMEKYALEPLKAVGWEGIWGFLVTVVVMVVLHLAYGSTEAGRYSYFDAREGLREMFHNRAVGISSIFIMISIGGFNYFGLSVTRSVSATSRSTIDTCRTLFIWIVSLGLRWETFKWLQVVGFALLVYGTFLFNDIVRAPFKSCVRPVEAEDEDVE